MNTINILIEKCVGCKLCMSACPFGAIKVENQKAYITDACNFCGACVDSCKFNAIEFIKSEGKKKDFSQYSGIWVFAEQTKGNIAGVVPELLGEARKLANQLDTDVSAVLIGSNLDDTAQTLISYGADIVYKVDSDTLEQYNDEGYSNILTQLIEKFKPEIVLIGATTYGRSLGPRVSSRLNTGLTADCTGLEIDKETGLLLQTRPAFGGNLMATIICPNHRPQMATVRPKVMKALEPDNSRKGKIIEPNITISNETKVKVIDVVNLLCEKVNLTEADIIVSVGRGIGDPKNISIIENFANVLGAAIGASRAVVDSGWVEYAHQVGQTGKTVGPKVYFACGISGAIQHLAGMSSSDTIIAINKNPDAPIFKVAHFGIVGDLLEVIPTLTKEFKSKI